jgi:hypothetical protein
LRWWVPLRVPADSMSGTERKRVRVLPRNGSANRLRPIRASRMTEFEAVDVPIAEFFGVMR